MKFSLRHLLGLADKTSSFVVSKSPDECARALRREMAVYPTEHGYEFNAYETIKITGKKRKSSSLRLTTVSIHGKLERQFENTTVVTYVLMTEIEPEYVASLIGLALIEVILAYNIRQYISLIDFIVIFCLSYFLALLPYLLTFYNRALLRRRVSRALHGETKDKK